MQNEPEIHLYPKKNIMGNHRRIQVIEFGVQKSIINKVFVGTVSKGDWQWSCYVSITCDKTSRTPFG